MPCIDRLVANVDLSSPVDQTARVLQLSGLFDIPPAKRSHHRMQVDLPLPVEWQVGLIVGPSGCGKSSLARSLWPEEISREYAWPRDKSVIDGFPSGMGIMDITGLLCSVGFSSPPAWLKPFHVLSTGEQFRVTCARTLAEATSLAVIDEFTSVVDRDVAKIASAAIQKAVRRRNQKLVAVTCHYDVAEWLEPDWVFQPQTGEFTSGRSLRRPAIQLEIARVRPEAWQLFKHAHYLSADLNKSSFSFVGFVEGRPAAFVAVMVTPGTRTHFREHRAVCLPDFQGVGIGSAMSEAVAALFRATGRPYRSITSHPAFTAHRRRSPFWKEVRSPALANRGAVAPGWVGAYDRLTASFEYVGPASPLEHAMRFGLPAWS